MCYDLGDISPNRPSKGSRESRKLGFGIWHSLSSPYDDLTKRTPIVLQGYSAGLLDDIEVTALELPEFSALRDFEGLSDEVRREEDLLRR